MSAHKHKYDVHPRLATHVYCTVCGFAVTAKAFPAKYRTLDVIVARANSTPAAIERMNAATEGR